MLYVVKIAYMYIYCYPVLYATVDIYGAQFPFSIGIIIANRTKFIISYRKLTVA